MQHSFCIFYIICFTGRHDWRALDEMKARREFMSRKDLRDTINKLNDMAPELLHLKPIEKDQTLLYEWLCVFVVYIAVVSTFFDVVA